MGLADVVASAVPGWYTLLHCYLAKGLTPSMSADASALQNQDEAAKCFVSGQSLCMAGICRGCLYQPSSIARLYPQDVLLMHMRDL